MATTNKVQLKLTLSDGKTAIINLPQAKTNLAASDLGATKFGYVSDAYATDAGATVTNIAVTTVVTTTTPVATVWNASGDTPEASPDGGSSESE